MSEEFAKRQTTVSWLVGLGISVMSCSILFILFAVYMAEVRHDLKENSLLLSAIQARQDAILTESTLIRKHMESPLAPVASTADGGAPAAPAADITVTVPTSAPSVAAPVPLTSILPEAQSPHVEVPVAAPAQSAVEKK